MNNNMGKTLHSYTELSNKEIDELLRLYNSELLEKNERRRLVKEIIFNQGLGQDITAQDLKGNINNRECTRNLLTRLFASYIEDAFLDIFIRKVKEDKDLTRFIKLHRERPFRSYKCLIGII